MLAPKTLELTNQQGENRPFFAPKCGAMTPDHVKVQVLGIKLGGHGGDKV